jgi:hypothetical protein
MDPVGERFDSSPTAVGMPDWSSLPQRIPVWFGKPGSTALSILRCRTALRLADDPFGGDIRLV